MQDARVGHRVASLGTGLRRSELVRLNCEHIQQREDRWLTTDLVDKHGRIRTVPLLIWAYTAFGQRPPMLQYREVLRVTLLPRTTEAFRQGEAEGLNSHELFTKFE